MTILPLDPAANANPAALRGFLGECAAAAAKAGRPRLVSISVRVAALDPLAVLESIFEPGQPHFYAERPDLESALAGAEVAAEFTAQGAGRFAAVQGWVDAVLADALAVGEVNAPFGGPHFFAAFTFLDEVEPGEPFPAAHVFVPRWQVARAADTTIAVANLLVGPGADLDAMAERVWRAHARFRSFEFGAGPGSVGRVPSPGRRSSRGVGTPPKVRSQADSHYRAAVENALARIGAGEFRKIVLARAIDVTAVGPLHPLELLNGLRQRFPSCYAFSLANGRGQSFIGASPERLVRVSQGLLETEALAGSIRRGAGASEDAGLAHELAHNDKEQREHRLVIEAVAGRLAALGLAPEFPPVPGLRRLANVQHLHTPVRAALGDRVRLLDAVAALHPTPATGGWPVDATVGHIRELEGFPRGLYAGALGWLNARGGGEFLVGLRSALVDGPHATLYAGAGIVAGSTPDRELAETGLKFRAMLDALLG